METNHKSLRSLRFWAGFWPLLVLALVLALDACQRRETYHRTASGIKVPVEVRQYLAALERGDLAAQRAAFARQALITDEMGIFVSEAEIGNWIRHHNAIRKQVDVLQTMRHQNGYTLLMRWTPHQDQHRWSAYYTFEYEAGRIARLHISSTDPTAGEMPQRVSL